VKENRGMFADDWSGKEGAEASVIDEFVNWNGGFDPDVDACENEKPNEDPVLA
jgi:hypothetical protein